MEKTTRADFARQVDGHAIDYETERLSAKGPGWHEIARTLVQRVNRTLDWADLGPRGSRYKLIATRGEAVVFADHVDESRVLKLRGRAENGFSGEFGCIVEENPAIGYLDLMSATLEQALEREALTYREFGFSCDFEALIADPGDTEPAGLLLSQRFVNGTAPTEREIARFMESNGWESQKRNFALKAELRRYAWKRGDILAVDANETNLVKADADGLIYPIDLIVWPDPTCEKT